LKGHSTRVTTLWHLRYHFLSESRNRFVTEARGFPWAFSRIDLKGDFRKAASLWHFLCHLSSELRNHGVNFSQMTLKGGFGKATSLFNSPYHLLSKSDERPMLTPEAGIEHPSRLREVGQLRPCETSCVR
jgi:hypothetical protein